MQQPSKIKFPKDQHNYTTEKSLPLLIETLNITVSGLLIVILNVSVLSSLVL